MSICALGYPPVCSRAFVLITSFLTRVNEFRSTHMLRAPQEIDLAFVINSITPMADASASAESEALPIGAAFKTQRALRHRE